jgi:diguanylate cyclase (GGDEF)-like protein
MITPTPTPTPTSTINPLDPSFLDPVEANLKYDDVTGLLSRLILKVILDNMASRCSLSEQHSILVIGLDHFERCEVTLGYEQGDRVLIELASIMPQELPPQNYLGRWGGGDFIVILPNAGLSEAVSAAEHLRMAIEQHKFVSCPMTLTVTIGVATTLMGSSWSSCSLLALAVARMYAGKNNLSPSLNLVWAGDLPPDDYEWQNAVGQPSAGPYPDNGHRSIGKIATAPMNNPLVPAFFDSIEATLTYDSLTGLLAYSALQNLLGNMYSWCSPGEQHSLLSIDIDHFKCCNDTLGREQGDHVLIEFASIMAQELPPQNYIGRWDGDDFVVILPNTGLSDAVSMAEHLRMAIEQHKFVSCPMKQTITIGVATTPLSKSWSSNSLLALAEARLCAGKNNLSPSRNLVWAGDLPPHYGDRWDPAGQPSAGPYPDEEDRHIDKMSTAPLFPDYFAPIKPDPEGVFWSTGTLRTPALMAILDEMSSKYAPDGGVGHSVLHIDIDHIDIDHSNPYEESIGSDANYHALIEIETIIAQELPSPHHLGRTNMEQFLVILPNTGLAAATTAAEHLRMTIAQRPLLASIASLTVTHTVTIGVATAPLNTSWSPEELITLADARTYVGAHCITPNRNVVWAGDLPDDCERQWKADWSIDWRRKWGTHWPSADSIVSGDSQQYPTSYGHVDDPHLAIGGVVLRFQSHRKDRCSVILDNGKKTTPLGEVNYSLILNELNELFTIGVDNLLPWTEIEDMDVFLIALFINRQCSMHARMDGDEYCLYFMDDNDRNIIATTRLNKECAAKALTDISALDKATKGESDIQRPPETLLSWIKAKIQSVFGGKNGYKH